jgi:hypothetical protein
MQTISEYMERKIWFYQPSFWKRLHELRTGDEVIGSIQQKGFFGMTWNVEFNNKKWDINRPSFWKRTLSIREAGYELPFAEFVYQGFRSKGSIRLQKGELIKIAPHLFKSFCEATNESGEVLFRIKLKSAMRDKAEVVIEKKTELVDNNPWLLMLAYIIALEQKHQAAHSAH